MTVVSFRSGEPADAWIAANHPGALRDWPRPDSGRLPGQIPLVESDHAAIGYFAYRPDSHRRPGTHVARAVLPVPGDADPKCSHCLVNSATVLEAKHGGHQLCERCRRYSLRHGGALPVISATGRAVYQRSA